jgi:hypothetical protein
VRVVAGDRRVALAAIWLCVSIYYTYRVSTFYIATWAIYRVIPFALLFWSFSWLFRSYKDDTAEPVRISDHRRGD